MKITLKKRINKLNLNSNKVKSELDKAWNPDSQAESTSGKETAKEIKETEV